MLHYEFTKDGKLFYRVNKTVARREYTAGSALIVCPAEMDPETVGRMIAAGGDFEKIAKPGRAYYIAETGPAAEIAERAVKAYFDYDPYNGTTEAEAVRGTLEMLKTVDGCRTIIENLLNIIDEK